MDRALDRIALVNRSSELTYTPAWWVPGAHLQTLWGKLVRRIPLVATHMERWTTPDDDELDIHRLRAPDAGKETPRLLLLHGLEGTIRSHYLQGTLALAQARGWAADVLVFRGCNGEVNRVRRMYHSGETTDIDFVVRRLISENPDQPLLIAGFSLGGNVLLKWLGEQGADAPGQLRAAAAVSVPFDLERGARNIEHGFSRVNLSTGKDVSKTRWAPNEHATRQALVMSSSTRAKISHHVYRQALQAIDSMPALRRATTFLARRSTPPPQLAR